MPETLQTFIWTFGVAFIVLLLGIVGYFVVRLIAGMDSFKVEVTGALGELRDTMTAIRTNMGRDMNDLHTRVKVIEEAGCIAHRRREDT